MIFPIMLRYCLQVDESKMAEPDNLSPKVNVCTVSKITVDVLFYSISPNPLALLIKGVAKKIPPRI